MRSLVVRRDKKYMKGKRRVDINLRYKTISAIVYIVQVSLLPLMFWSDSEFLLRFHKSDALKLAGIFLCYIGLVISVSALVYLGRNYSPCYDSHEPFDLVTNGPYRWVRHPGWLSKFMVGRTCPDCR
jgi:protein-S-isoprenylcysteine O-methyltransferase Ste14